jgi:uncharacterized protein YdeI (YjbR/CyaY-like superfamily)
MGKKDSRVDAYIAGSAPFAQPILRHLRKVVHAGCPAVEETIKWQFPHFDHKGMMCSMAAFQRHCAFGFWKASLILGNSAKDREAMGHFGRIQSLSDLPTEKKLIAYVRKASELNDAGVKVSRSKSKAKPPLVVPDDLTAALARKTAARRTFESFSPSHKREYVEWITGAKREETRKRRLRKAIEWMSEGKVQNWKYLLAR